jgi:hypothetical protein
MKQLNQNSKREKKASSTKLQNPEKFQAASSKQRANVFLEFDA